MPKLNVRPPKLGRDGKYAVVYSGGKKIRLGLAGTEDAQKNYLRFIAEWAAIGDAADPHKKKSYLIDELAVSFLKWAKGVYGKSDYGNYRTAINMTLEIYSGTLVKDFGSRALCIVRDSFVAKGYSRKYCNKLVGFVRAMFVWGIEYEFVTQEVAGALKFVKSVHRKQAHDNPSRKDVPDEVVKRTLLYLLPIYADMVTLQRLATMRPSEVCRMKVGEIDRTGEVWKYEPPEHKNKWRGHKRIIFFGLPEQEILVRRMAGKGADDFVFTPREAVQERKERDAANRKTKVQPSQVARKEKRAKNPKRKYRDYYTSDVYYNAIESAIESANKQRPDDKKIPHWYPYQLRHTAITQTTETAGLDEARAVAGQKSLDVTMGYNHADEAISKRAAMKRQNPFE